jgi:hypothetical protein
MEFTKNANGKKILKMTKSDWQVIGRKAGWIKTTGQRRNIHTRTIVNYEAEMTGGVNENNSVFLNLDLKGSIDITSTKLGQFILKTIATNPAVLDEHRAFTLQGVKEDTVDESSGNGWDEPPDSDISNTESDVWLLTSALDKIVIPRECELEIWRKIPWRETSSHTVDPDEGREPDDY